MNKMRKLALGYFVAAGIAGHLLILGVWIAKPELVWRAEAQAVNWLARHGLNNAVAGPQSNPRETVLAALPPWTPRPNKGMPAGQIKVNGIAVPSLAAASKRLRNGDILDIGPGTYRQPLTVSASDVTVRGHGLVVFEKAQVGGKGTFLIIGNDVRIENIECRKVSVPDHNGSCVRQQGVNLTLDGVYFHDAQQGLLTGHKPGKVTILNSRFELLGNAGRSHGIYVGGGELLIRDSLFLSSMREGHEVKSRATSTIIERSIIASLGGNDSRLVDISNGGQLIIRDSVLEVGPASVNHDVIGFALEKQQHKTHSIELRDNLILLDTHKNSVILNQRKGTPEATINGNLIVGARKQTLAGLNAWVKNRKDAKLPPYPALPPVPTGNSVR